MHRHSANLQGSGGQRFENSENLEKLEGPWVAVFLCSHLSLPSANQVCKGNAFTSVCLSTDGMCISSCNGQGCVCPGVCSFY